MRCMEKNTRVNDCVENGVLVSKRVNHTVGKVAVFEFREYDDAGPLFHRAAARNVSLTSAKIRTGDQAV